MVRPSVAQPERDCINTEISDSIGERLKRVERTQGRDVAHCTGFFLACKEGRLDTRFEIWKQALSVIL